MSNTSEQNGRQLPTDPASTAPPTDPRTRGVRAVPAVRPTPDSQRFCKDFVWGICSMKEKCKYIHELDFNFMRQTLKFCHDYQNRTGCLRPDCTYIHANREEHNLFLNSGVIPRVLVERYAAMAAPRKSNEFPPEMMYLNEYMQPPPPPPLPLTNGAQSVPVAPSMTPQGAMASTMPVYGPMAASSSQTQAHLPMSLKVTLPAMMPSNAAAPTPMPTMLTPPPPPPPTLSMAPTLMTAPVYTATPVMQHTSTSMYPVTVCPQLQQPQQAPAYVLPVQFDPSVPPPPMPMSVQAHMRKRPALGEPEAGPSKVIKHADGRDAVCDPCVDRHYSLQLSLQEEEKRIAEEVYMRQQYDKRTEEFEKGRMLLRSLLSPYLFQATDEFIDSNTPMPSPLGEIFASTSSSPTYNASPQMPTQLMFKLMEYFISKAEAEHTVTTSPLESLARRSFSSSEFSRLMRVSDFSSMMSMLDRLTSNTESRVSSIEPLTLNGLSRLNGSLELSPGARYSAPAAAPRYATPYQPDMPLYQPEPPQPYAPYPPQAPSAPYPPQAPSAPYPPQAPSAPYPPQAPSARPLYQPYPGTPGMSYGAAGPSPAHSAAGPSTTPAPPPGAAPPYPGSQYMSQMPPNHPHNPHNPYYRPYQ